MNCAVKMTTLSASLQDAIDGGEECRGRDAQLSEWAQKAEALEAELAELTEQHEATVDERDEENARCVKLETALLEIQTALLAVVEPWLGVSANLLPAYVVTGAPLLNKLHALLIPGTEGKHCESSAAEGKQ